MYYLVYYHAIIAMHAFTVKERTGKAPGSFHIISTTFLGDPSELGKTWFKVSTCTCGRVKPKKNLYSFLAWLPG